jgi:hypothetical protein
VGKKKVKTKNEYIASRYVMLRKQLQLYKLFFLANDKNTNSEVILDRNLTVINAVIPNIWWIFTDSLFNSIFIVLGDMFDVHYPVCGSILEPTKENNKYEESLNIQLKKYKLGRYFPLVKKLKTARDKYVAHSERLLEDRFPIKLKDLLRLEKFFNEIEDKVLEKMIKDTSEDYHYRQTCQKDEVLQEFDHLMNVLYLDYYSIDGEFEDTVLEKRELLINETLQRRKELQKQQN